MQKKCVSWLFIALFAAGLLARVGYTVYVYKFKNPSEPRAKVINTDHYDTIALNLVKHGEFSVHPGKPTAMREPLYPFVLASLHLVFGSSPAVGLVLNIILGMLTCWMIYCLTDRLFKKKCIALIALAAACFFPEWIFYGAYLYREPLVVALLSAWAWLWVSRGDQENFVPYILMGLLFGLISLALSPMIMLGGFFVLIAAYRLPRRVWLKTLGAFLLCGALIQVPWIIRNYRLLGRFVPGASRGGETIYFALLKDYDKPLVPLEQPLMDGRDKVIREIIDKNLTREEAEPLYYKAIWDIFIHKPGIFWTAFVRKVIKLWRPYPYKGWDYKHSFTLLKLIGLLSNVTIMVLGLAGALLALKSRINIDFLIMLPSVMTFVYGLSWATMRFHSPLMVGLIPLAAFAAYRGCEFFRDIIFPRVLR